MPKPDYAAAYGVAKKCYTDLVAAAAVDLIDARDSRHRLQEVLEDYANKIWQLREVLGALAEEKASKALADLKGLPQLPPEPKPQSDLRVAMIPCLPDRISDSVNQWLANHPYADVVSIQFGQFERTFGAIVLYRWRQEGETVRKS